MYKEPVTPEKKIAKATKKVGLEEILTSELLSPYSCSLLTAPSGVQTSLRKQPDYLLSPSPAKKDLFAQLLGTECKHNTILFDSNSVIEE